MISNYTTVTSAILSGEQADRIDPLDANQTFSIRIRPIDSITRRPLAKAQWGNWTWTVTVSIQKLPKFNSNGVLITNQSSLVNLTSLSNIITISDLRITEYGMYILDINMFSSDKKYDIRFSTSTVLVQQSLGLNHFAIKYYITSS